ncbi:MAG TPA: Hpt domain-containing protein [Rhodanobacteraceae bacterium]
MQFTSSDAADAAFQTELDALRQRFLAGVPARRAALMDAWRACVDGAAEAAWLRLRDVAHKLSGSAPCYGLDALGAFARELDGLLSARPPCRTRAAADAAVERLLQALAAVGTGA